MSQDPLLWGLGKANLTGAFSTQARARSNAMNFVEFLRSNGLGVRKWSNISDHHLQLYADHCLKEGISAGTLKTYLSGIRSVCFAHGNEKISTSNAKLSIPNRELYTNEDKSISDEVLTSLIETLKQDKDPHGVCERLVPMVMLMRDFGLRFEEARKVDVRNVDFEKRTVLIDKGTKGGRPRLLTNLSDRQLETVAMAERYQTFVQKTGRFNMMPANMSEKKFVEKAYYRLDKHGLSKAKAGCSTHGCRHARGQEIYEQATGQACPIKAGTGGNKIDTDTHWAGLRAVNQAFGHGSGRRVAQAYVGRR